MFKKKKRQEKAKEKKKTHNQKINQPTQTESEGRLDGSIG